MSEIKINTSTFEEKIQRLKDLSQTCEDIEIKEKSVVGSGESVAMVTVIDKEYTALRKSLLNLIENSISFFENIKISVTSADEEAANKLNQ